MSERVLNTHSRPGTWVLVKLSVAGTEAEMLPQDPHNLVSKAPSQPTLQSGLGPEEIDNLPKVSGVEKGLTADYALSWNRCTSEAESRRVAWSSEKGKLFGGFGAMLGPLSPSICPHPCPCSGSLETAPYR